MLERAPFPGNSLLPLVPAESLPSLMLLNRHLGLSQVSLQPLLLTVIVLLILLQALLFMMLNHLLVMINIHLSLMEISDRVTPPAGTTPLTISMTMPLLTLTTMVMPVMPAMQMLVYDVAQT